MTNMIKTQQESNMVMMQKKQGIVTILGSNCGETNTTYEHSSLRRTLSTDLSSHKWLSHQTMKKVPSSDQIMQHSSSSSKTIADSLSSSSSSEDEAEAEKERLEIWSSIQRNKKAEEEKGGTGAFDMWNSLVSLKENNGISKSLPESPYIHPLVKRKKSCLSEKSLEICTESLGSETGSDGLFSSHPSYEKEGDKEEEHQQQQQEEHVKEEEKVVIEEEPKYNYGGGATKKCSPSRSFPPPIPSLGPSLHMRTHRDNGRLVLEAVSAPSNNNFCVQRQDGRLVLTFSDAANDDDDEVAEENDDDGVSVEELEEEFEGFEEVHSGDEAEDESDETEEVEDIKDIEKKPLLSSEITTNGVHRLAMVMNKAIGLVNRNPKWSEKLNELDVNVIKEMETNPVTKSLPPRPRVTRLVPSTNFNAYEYYGKTKPTTAQGGVTTTISNSLPQHQKLNNNSSITLVSNNSTSKVIFSGDFKKMTNDERQELMVVRVRNGDYKLVHNLDQSCKDSRRSFLFWKPYCIATS